MANDIDTNQYASRTDLNYKFGDEFFYPGDINYSTIEQMKERDETIASGLDIFVGDKPQVERCWRVNPRHFELNCHVLDVPVQLGNAEAV